MTITRSTVLIPVLLAALALGACGDEGADSDDPGASPPPAADATRPADGSGAPGPGGGLTVEEALASDLDGPLLVAGSLVVTGDTVRLCSALAESYPPQCGGASLTVDGLDLAEFSLESEGSVRWSNDQVSILGEIRDGVLVVDLAVQ